MQTGESAPVQDLSRVADLMARAQYAPALSELLPRVQSARACPVTLECTIICYSELRDDATAWALSDLGATQFPDAAGLWAIRSRLAASTGRFDMAREAADRALTLDPGNLGALVQLNMLAPFEKGSKRDKQLRRVLKKPVHDARALAEGYRAVAMVEQAAGFYTRAFHHFKQSNRYQDRAYDPAGDSAFVAAQRQHFVAAPEVAPVRYLFVGGMPRSGTTLLETALLRHPAVASVGETSCLGRAQQRLGGGARAFDWVANRDEGLRQDLRAEVLAVLEKDNAGASLILEKQPLAVFHYGLAQWLLPEARFVVMERHPMGCGLSNYQANFRYGNGFSARLESIAHKYLSVEAATDDYAAKMPDILRRQSFRALVETPEPALRAICAFAGLDWDAAVLSPEAADHVQRTHSMMQVREGINRAGLDRWTSYSAQLEPLRAALGGADYISAWEARDASG